MFKALGILVAAYTAYSIFRGEVYARSGAWGKKVERTVAPTYFWVVITIYSGLAVALMTAF